MDKRAGQNLLTHSRITCWLTCREKERIEYGLGMRKEMNAALRMGDAWHHGRDALNKTSDLAKAHDAIASKYQPLLHGDEERVDRLLLEREKLQRLLDGWFDRWQHEPREIVASELAFDIPLRNPKTGRPSRIWRHGGKIDTIIALPGKGLALEELKTTSDPIGPDAPYWKALRMDAQITRYMIAAMTLGYPVETVMYDVVHKPGTNPKLIKGVRETIPEYGERLAEDIRSRPEFYFARVEVPRMHSSIREMREELWQIGKDMHNARPYRDSEQCIGHKYTCDHLDACSNDIDLVNETPDGYHRLTTTLHPELEPDNATDTAASE